MGPVKKHWTERSIEDYVFKISSDFVFQLVRKMDAERINKKKLAGLLNVSVGRVSQVLNNPGNLTLKNCVHYARTLGMEAALVAYEDFETDHFAGPVNSEIFFRCWQKLGRPRDFFDLADTVTVQPAVLPSNFSYFIAFDLPQQETITSTWSEVDFKPGVMADTSKTHLTAQA